MSNIMSKRMAVLGIIHIITGNLPSLNIISSIKQKIQIIYLSLSMEATTRKCKTKFRRQSFIAESQ